ncbi:MAG: Holliday junction branch migration protein RuvA [Candidatus Firestonebacteria bacterium]|nr:Holliday junction branch migration protein RuvA [Candidatus Firestonebacteria bacterium]
MIYYVKGRLEFKSPGKIVIETNGIGYQILIPVSTFNKLPDINESIKIYTHYQVREDTVNLIGFYTLEEMELFEKLITVSSIGVRSAINILSNISVKDFKEAIILGNLALLTTIPGIGKKTGERVILELKDKIGTISDGFINSANENNNGSVLNEAIDALVSLGYKLPEARSAVLRAKEIIGKDFSSGEYLKQALKNLGK